MNNIVDIVDEFFEKKSKADRLKKEHEKLNREIKSILVSDDAFLVDGTSSKKNNHIVVTDNCVAEYYETENVSIDECRLIEFLKANGYEKAIKTVEVLDSDVLESMLYNGEIPTEHQKKMNDFKEIKRVAKLVVKKRKDDKRGVSKSHNTK